MKYKLVDIPIDSFEAGLHKLNNSKRDKYTPTMLIITIEQLQFIEKHLKNHYRFDALGLRVYDFALDIVTTYDTGTNSIK